MGLSAGRRSRRAGGRPSSAPPRVAGGRRQLAQHQVHLGLQRRPAGPAAAPAAPRTGPALGQRRAGGLGQRRGRAQAGRGSGGRRPCGGSASVVVRAPGPQVLEQGLPVAPAPVQDLERVVVERLGQQVERGGDVLARHAPVGARALHARAGRRRSGTAAPRPRRRPPRSAAGISPASSRALNSACSASASSIRVQVASSYAARPTVTSYGSGREPCTVARHHARARRRG